MSNAVSMSTGCALDRGAEDVVRRRHRRALELLAQVGRERRQHLRERRGRRRAAGDLVALDVPRLGRGRVGGDPRLGRRDSSSSIEPTTSCDETGVLGLLRPELGALAEHLHDAVGDAEHAGHPGDAAAAGQQAELDLGQADLGAGDVGDDPVVAGERDLEAAAQRRAVDRGDDRLAELLEPAELRLHPGALVVERLRVGLGGLHQVVEVGAGEEGLLRRGDDDAGDVVALGLEPVDGGVHRLDVGGVHGVGRGVRVVEGEDDDAVVALLVADRALGIGRDGRGGQRVAHVLLFSWISDAGVGAQMRSMTVAMPMPPPTQSVARP